jgi:hypothetical protein
MVWQFRTLKPLHEHGFITSYHEDLRFRKSAARYLGDNKDIPPQFMGLSRTDGVILAWFATSTTKFSCPMVDA